MEIASLILNFILSSGLIGMLIYYTPRKRKENAEARSAELQNMNTEGSVWETRIKFLSNQIETLQIQLDESRANQGNQYDLFSKKLGSVREYANKLEIDLINERKKSEHYYSHTCKVDNCKLRLLIDKI